MCLHRVVPWPFSCPLLLLSDPIQNPSGIHPGCLAGLPALLRKEPAWRAERGARSFQGYLCGADSRQEIKMCSDDDDDPLSTVDGGH